MQLAWPKTWITRLVSSGMVIMNKPLPPGMNIPFQAKGGVKRNSSRNRQTSTGRFLQLGADDDQTETVVGLP